MLQGTGVERGYDKLPTSEAGGLRLHKLHDSLLSTLALARDEFINNGWKKALRLGVAATLPFTISPLFDNGPVRAQTVSGDESGELTQPSEDPSFEAALEASPEAAPGMIATPGRLAFQTRESTTGRSFSRVVDADGLLISTSGFPTEQATSPYFQMDMRNPDGLWLTQGGDFLFNATLETQDNTERSRIILLAIPSDKSQKTYRVMLDQGKRVVISEVSQGQLPITRATANIEQVSDHQVVKLGLKVENGELHAIFNDQDVASYPTPEEIYSPRYPGTAVNRTDANNADATQVGAKVISVETAGISPPVAKTIENPGASTQPGLEQVADPNRPREGVFWNPSDAKLRDINICSLGDYNPSDTSCAGNATSFLAGQEYVFAGKMYDIAAGDTLSVRTFVLGGNGKLNDTGLENPLYTYPGSNKFRIKFGNLTFNGQQVKGLLVYEGKVNGVSQFKIGIRRY